MAEISIEEVLEKFTAPDLLKALGFDEDLCFISDQEVADYAAENAEWIGLDLKPDFKYMNDVEIYDRVIEVLEKNKLTYSEWNDFLTKYE